MVQINEEELLGMSKEQLKVWFFTDNKSGCKCNEKWLKNNYNKLYLKIIKNSDEVDLKFNAKIWLYLNDLNKSPKCLRCGNKTNFGKNLKSGFGKFCSHDCAFNNGKIRSLTKNNFDNTKTFLESIYYDNKSGLRSTDYYIKEAYPKEYNEINNLPVNIENNTSPWCEKLYNYIHKLEKRPTCIECGNKVKFISLKGGYRKYCSIGCSSKSEIVHENLKKSNLDKYGVDNVFKIPNFIEKIKNIKKTDKMVEEIELKIKPFKLNKFDCFDRLLTTSLKKRNIKIFSLDNNLLEILNKNNNVSSDQYWYDYFKILHTDLFLENEKKIKLDLSFKNRRRKLFAKKLNILEENIEFVDGREFMKIKNLCPIHNEFIIPRLNIDVRLRLSHENICTICNPIKENSSIKEKEIREFIEKDLQIETRKIYINRNEIDIYLDDYRIGFEHDGIFWHNHEKKKFNENYHLNKTELCENNNIKLIHIFENDWISKKDIVKGKIKKILNKTDFNIESKQLNCILINNKNLLYDFFNKNYLFKYNNDKKDINIGIFYKNNLTQIMVFSKLNEKKYHLKFFCTKLNFNILDGYQKILNFFVINYKPNSIISYLDRRYSNGSELITLGFDIINKIEPKPWFFNKGRDKIYETIEEYKLSEINKKHKNYNIETDYSTIYDSGYLKLELKSQ